MVIKIVIGLEECTIGLNFTQCAFHLVIITSIRALSRIRRDSLAGYIYHMQSFSQQQLYGFSLHDNNNVEQ